MSLFKTREFWCTTSEDDEYFDQNSLIVTKLNSDSDCIITGSQSGVLRIFKPCCELNETNNNLSGYNIRDLLLEKIFDCPILQLDFGRLVSGSQNVQIAILHPRSLGVYFLTTKDASSDHGTQYIFQLIYEHKLKRLAYNMTVGPFGGTQNRDFICVQSLDGLLSFFEQETFTFSCNLPEFLLPSPIIYVKKNDSFLTVAPNWYLENYSYKSFSEISGNGDKIKSNWCYNLGEAVLDIQVIDDFINKSAWICVLGERNLYCFNEKGKVMFMKKLEYSPICFNVYVLEDKLISMVVSETNTLLIYQNTSLKWSAQLQFQPTAIKRAFLQTIKGVIVLLSDEGRLECCYLGTEPSLFVAPPLQMKEIDFEQVAQELVTLNKTIRNAYHNDVKVDKSTVERELTINLSVSPHLEPHVDSATQEKCLVTVDVIPQALFEELQLSFLVQRPLKIEPNVKFYWNLSERSQISCSVILAEPMEVNSLKLVVVASFVSSLGVPRTLYKTTVLPMKLAVETCAKIPKENQHKITLGLNCSPVGLSGIFPEYVGENSLSQSSNTVGFKSKIASESEDQIVSILLAKSSDRYRLQSNSFASLNLFIEQLVYRLQKHFSKTQQELSIRFSSALPAGDLLPYISEHFTIRQKVNSLQNELTLLTTQFRIIQKRLIAKFKAKNPTSLLDMEILLDDTYEDIGRFSDELQRELRNLDRAQVALGGALNVIANLAGLSEITNEELLVMVQSAFNFDVSDLETQNWEDVLDGSMCYLLRTLLAKSDKDKLRAAQTSFDEIKDISKLEKHVVQVLERFPNTKTAKLEEDVKEIEDSDEGETETIPVGSQFGESSLRLLSARRSLLNRRHKVVE